MDTPNDPQHRDPVNIAPEQTPEKVQQDARALPRPLLYTVAILLILIGVYFITGARWTPHSAQDPAMRAGMSVQEDIKDAKKNIPLESKGVTTTPTNNANTTGRGSGDQSAPASSGPQTTTTTQPRDAGQNNTAR